MQETIEVLAMAFGTALFSDSGASELVVALIVAAGLFVIAVHSFALQHHHSGALHDHTGNIRSRRP